MPNYQVTFSYKTSENQKIPGRCVFVISLSFHQPELNNTDGLNKFSSVLSLLNLTFDEMDIVLSDTLNKHNAFIYFPGVGSFEKSLALGDAWLKSDYFNKTKTLLEKKPLIKRWNELVNETNFVGANKIISNLYKENKYFISTVDSVCANFVAFIFAKRKKTIENVNSQANPPSIYSSKLDYNEAFDKSKDYVLEECAVTLVFRLQGYANLFHIGKVNDAVDWVAKNFINVDAGYTNLIELINNNPLKIIIVSKYQTCSTIADSNENNFKNGPRSQTYSSMNRPVNYFKRSNDVQSRGTQTDKEQFKETRCALRGP